MSLTTQDLLDRAEITDAINAYSQALDQREWSLLDAAFTPDADITLLDRDVHYTPAQLQELLSGANDSTRLSGQHLGGNTWFEINGDTAHTVTEVHWVTLQTTDDPVKFKHIRAGGIYVDDLVRTDAGWRIARRELALKNRVVELLPYDAADLDKIRYTLATHWFQTF